MNSTEEASLYHRLAQVEARLAKLEAYLARELPEIPWQVLVAAVAALVPGGRIVSVNPAMDQLPSRTLNFWTVGGRLDHFESHRRR